jgi:hypothetical protein
VSAVGLCSSSCRGDFWKVSKLDAAGQYYFPRLILEPAVARRHGFLGRPCGVNPARRGLQPSRLMCHSRDIVDEAWARGLQFRPARATSFGRWAGVEAAEWVIKAISELRDPP